MPTMYCIRQRFPQPVRMRVSSPTRRMMEGRRGEDSIHRRGF
jgi:hypothetical protein